jgi:hypothetical protein
MGLEKAVIVVGGNGNEMNQLWMPSDLLFDKHGNLYVFDTPIAKYKNFTLNQIEDFCTYCKINMVRLDLKTIVL